MSSSKKGMFISFEGIDGCGKSTQVKLLINKLKKEGIESLLVREPGGPEISEQIRSVLLNINNQLMTSRTEALLMTASRSQLTKEVILPALKSHKYIIADRYKDSTLAYQSGGRGLKMNFLIALNEFATYNVDPDITFFIDIDPDIAAKRSKNKSLDRIETNGVNFQTMVRDSYLKIIKLFPERIHTIDGSQSIQAIHETILQKIYLKNNEK